MELNKIGEKTYYIKNPTNIGIYKINENEIYIIDSGNDKEAGKKILKITEEQGWTIKGIINTHSNADHIGGNKLIQDRTNAIVLSHGIEKHFIESPILEPSFLYGGYPFNNLQNKFLLAKSSSVKEIENNLPEGLEYFSLKGHYFDMIGIKTSDDIYFLGDSLFSEETINKYHIFFIYNIKEYLSTLDYLETLKGKYYIPSHAEITTDITNLIKINRNKINEIINKILELLETPKTFEELLKETFNAYNLTMNTNQYVLIGSTLKSYLSYLNDESKITYEFTNNTCIWKKLTTATESWY